MTAPSPCWALTGRLCLGGVDGRTGLGRLFRLENEESRLLGDITEVSEVSGEPEVEKI